MIIVVDVVMFCGIQYPYNRECELKLTVKVKLIINDNFNARHINNDKLMLLLHRTLPIC